MPASTAHPYDPDRWHVPGDRSAPLPRFLIPDSREGVPGGGVIMPLRSGALEDGVELGSPRGLWQAALGELQMLIAAPVYENFLKGTTGLGLEGGTLTVSVPSDFMVGWLDTKLRPMLTQTVSRIAGEPLTLRFLTGEIAAAPPPPVATPVAAQAGGGGVAVAVGAPVAAAPAMAAPPAPLPSRQPASELRFNPNYTFSSFIVGKSNHLAHAAAQSVAATPGMSYNPLFLYGGVGLGKTHLLQAIGHECVNAGLRVVYVSSEQFTNDFVNAIRDRRAEEFRARYRTADVLLIDDIQFIAGKEQTQEEFFHTFNDLHSARRQIVITSDRSPKQIALLEDRMVSRFEWGLIADVQPPDYETRLAILRTKADEQRVVVPGGVLDLIAQRVSENIRELEGALNRVIAFARLTGEDVSMALAARALGDIAPAPRRRAVLPETIIDTVADYFGLAPQRLAGQARDKALVHARQVAMYLLRNDGARPVAEIGKMLKRDHTTVLHGTEKIERALPTDPELRGELAEIRARLAAG